MAGTSCNQNGNPLQVIINSEKEKEERRLKGNKLNYPYVHSLSI